MEPFTIAVISMAAITAVSSIANYLNSSESNKIASQARNRLEGLIDKLQAPNFDVTTLAPPELKLLETYTPKFADLVYDVAPELVTLSDRAKMGTGAQDAALTRFQQISQGNDPSGNLGVIAALDQASQQSGAQRDAVLNDMSRQGLTPSSSAYANLQYGAGSQSQKNMFMTALQAALADRSRRDSATSQSANLGGQIAGFEMNLEKLNDDIINQVNRRNTQARREYLQNRADTMNKANLYNIDRRQKYADQNLNNIYESQIRGQDLRNKQIAANYQNESDKLGMKAGVSNNRVQDIYGAGRDRSNLISGLANAGMTGVMMYNNNHQRQLDRDAYGNQTQATTNPYSMQTEPGMYQNVTSPPYVYNNAGTSSYYQNNPLDMDNYGPYPNTGGVPYR
jgi:hypothetical protein